MKIVNRLIGYISSLWQQSLPKPTAHPFFKKPHLAEPRVFCNRGKYPITIGKNGGINLVETLPEK